MARLAASDVPGGYMNGFGSSIAISGDYIVVGAVYDPCSTGLDIGAVYIFRRLGPNWIEHVKLTPATQMWDYLGSSVDIDGDTMVASAPHTIPGALDHGGPGAVYVFRRDDQGTPTDHTDDLWLQQAKLASPVGLVDKSFGAKVAVSGDIIAVSYHFFVDKVEIFRRDVTSPDGWTYEATVAGLPGEGFGLALDIDGNRIAVGALGYDDRRGRAYVFAYKRLEWVEEGWVQGDAPARLDDFGASVSISGDYLVVGAPHDDDAGVNAGAAYVFARDESGAWVRHTRLASPEVVTLDAFGSSVSIDRNLIAVSKGGKPPALLYGDTMGTWDRNSSFPGDAAYGAFNVVMRGQYALLGVEIYALRHQHSLADFASFASCISSEIGSELSPACQPFDFTADGRVDLVDFEKFMGTFAGP